MRYTASFYAAMGATYTPWRVLQSWPREHAGCDITVFVRHVDWTSTFMFRAAFSKHQYRAVVKRDGRTRWRCNTCEDLTSVRLRAERSAESLDH